jgi:hypothetical protein
MGFFDVFTIRSLKRSDIKIPNTMLCDEGSFWLMQVSGISGCSTLKRTAHM